MIQMTSEILDVIIAVQDYKKWIISDGYAKKETRDWFNETENYYHSLPLPNELKKNRTDYERILDVPQSHINAWCKMNREDLEKEVWRK